MSIRWFFNKSNENYDVYRLIKKIMPKNKQGKKSEPRPTRRSFLNILWLILGGVALAEFVAVAFAFLRPRKLKARGEDSDSVIAAGAIERFAPNSVMAFVRGKLYLARLEDGGFLASSRTCSHLGCSV